MREGTASKEKRCGNDQQINPSLLCFQLHLVGNIAPLDHEKRAFVRAAILTSRFSGAAPKRKLKPLIFFTLFPCIRHAGDIFIKSTATASLRRN